MIEFNDQFLVGPRPDHTVLAGKWEFPGGKVEPPESPPQAAVRECREETGCRVEVEKRLLMQTVQYDHGTVELHFYLCRLSKEAASPLPHKPFQWVLRQDLHNYDFPSGNAQLIRMLVKGNG